MTHFILQKLQTVKSLILLFSILTCALPSSGQNVEYFPFNSVVGISTNPNNFFWMNFRVTTNSYFTSLTTDVSPQFTVAETKKADFYVGGGVKINTYNVFNNYNPVEGYFLNTGVMARPFEKYKKLHITFEISPYAERKMDAGLFRTMLGIGYNFNQWK